MSIAFSCTSCAKKLQAPDEFAGRRMKCKGCGEVSTVPGKKAVAVAAKGAAKAKAPAPKKSAAPKPAKSVKPPEPKVRDVPPPPPLAAPPVAVPPIAVPLPRAEPNPWADLTLEQRSTPWQHGDQFVEGATHEDGGLNWFNLFAVLVFLAGLAVAGWFFWPKT